MNFLRNVKFERRATSANCKHANEQIDRQSRLQRRKEKSSINKLLTKATTSLPTRWLRGQAVTHTSFQEIRISHKRSLGRLRSRQRTAAAAATGSLLTRLTVRTVNALRRRC